MDTDTGRFCAVVSLYAVTGVEGDILSQKLSIYGRRFEHRNEQSSLLRGWGRKATLWKDEYLKTPTAAATAGVFTSTVLGWDRSVGIGWLKGRKKKNCACRGASASEIPLHRPNNWLWSFLGRRQQEMLSNSDPGPSACVCKKRNACVPQWPMRKSVAFLWDSWCGNWKNFDCGEVWFIQHKTTRGIEFSGADSRKHFEASLVRNFLNLLALPEPVIHEFKHQVTLSSCHRSHSIGGESTRKSALSPQKDFALGQALICTTALVGVEQEEPQSGVTDSPVPVQVCFARLSSPSFEVQQSEDKPEASL